MKRYKSESYGNRVLSSDVSDTLNVFVHGFTGNSDNTYWGELENLFEFEHRVSNHDFLFFDYNSNRSLWPNVKTLVGKARGMATIDEVVNNLCDTVRFQCGEKEYEKVNLIGHSLGGHLILEAAQKNSVEKIFNLSSLCLIAAPVHAPLVAKVHGFFGRNKQTIYLSNQSRIRDNVVNIVNNLRNKNGQKNSIPVGYIHSLRDNIVKDDDTLIFDDFVTINAEHTWFRNIKNSLDLHYQYILNWITLHQFVNKKV